MTPAENTNDHSFIKTLEASLQGPRQRFLQGRLIKHVMEGTMTVDLYKALLKETYHFVKHTPDHLILASEHLPSDTVDDNLLIERYRAHAKGEMGHEIWALNDLEALGEDIQAIKESEPLPHTLALIAYEYYTITKLNPKALLGLEYAMEGLTAKAGGATVKVLQKQLDLPDSAVTFFAKHAILDASHVEDDVEVINNFINTKIDQDAVLKNATDSVELYSAMYDGICDSVGL